MRWPLRILIALAACLAASADAHAGWIVIRNDTKQAVVVVEIAGTPNRPIQGKPVKIQPGETYREFQPGTGQKTFAVYDAAKLNVPLAQQTIAWRAEDSTFSILSDVKGTKLATADRK
jgi:SpoVK/Ycf46/Vps4 family AAA+-type ATPase